MASMFRASTEMAMEGREEYVMAYAAANFRREEEDEEEYYPATNRRTTVQMGPGTYTKSAAGSKNGQSSTSSMMGKVPLGISTEFQLYQRAAAAVSSAFPYLFQNGKLSKPRSTYLAFFWSQYNYRAGVADTTLGILDVMIMYLGTEAVSRATSPPSRDPNLDTEPPPLEAAATHKEFFFNCNCLPRHLKEVSD